MVNSFVISFGLQYFYTVSGNGQIGPKQPQTVSYTCPSILCDLSELQCTEVYRRNKNTDELANTAKYPASQEEQAPPLWMWIHSCSLEDLAWDFHSAPCTTGEAGQEIQKKAMAKARRYCGLEHPVRLVLCHNTVNGSFFSQALGNRKVEYDVNETAACVA